MTEPIRLVLLEDEDLLRSLLSDWIDHQDGLTLVGAYRSCALFLADAPSLADDVDVILTDVYLGDGDGVSTAADLVKSTARNIGIVVISGRPTSDLFQRLSTELSGGWAFLLKNSNGLANLSQAIHAVRNGMVMVDPNLPRMNPSAGAAGLTDQEQAVMERVADGKSNSTIAKEIFMSEKSVERILSSVYQKYGVEGSSKTLNPRVRATLQFRGLIS